MALFPPRTTSLPPTIGVLALQGAFAEHVTAFHAVGATALEVRTLRELESCDGLVLPGGESTTIALIAERTGLWPALVAFAASGRPVWGTCAGLILLADRAEAATTKQGGQRLLGGLDVTVARNYFGSQVDSFEAVVELGEGVRGVVGGGAPPAVFIRAPAVLQVGPGAEAIAWVVASGQNARVPQLDGGDEPPPTRVVVGVRSTCGPPLLGTAFHPELTPHTGWHALFLDMVAKSMGQVGFKAAAPPPPVAHPAQTCGVSAASSALLR